MSIPPIECIYITQEIIREGKNGNSNFSFSSSVPMVRLLYELCWAMVFFLFKFLFIYFCLFILLVENLLLPFDYQVRGELPFQKCKAVLDAVEFTERVSKDELGSCFADIITQLAQDVSFFFFFLGFIIIFCWRYIEAYLISRQKQEKMKQEACLGFNLEMELRSFSYSACYIVEAL